MKQPEKISLITPEQAWEIIQASAPLCAKVIRTTEAALGYVLAEPLKSPINLPLFDNSAMDGYALKFSDYAGDIRQYSVRGTVSAGKTKPLEPLGKGEVYRIFTGAAIPTGADTVIMREQVVEEKNSLLIQNPSLQQGANIRKQGRHIHKGDVILEKGHRLNAGSIGFLSSLGIAKVKVFDKPKISVIVTGDELVRPGSSLRPGQIFESNSGALKAALKVMDLKPVSCTGVKDIEIRVLAAIRKALKSSDLIILTGGISAGDLDFVKTALPKAGVKCLFYQLAQKPGKPLFFGKKKKTLVFALPGNPASVLTCFYEYVSLAIQCMQGGQDSALQKIHLPLAEGYLKNPEFSLFLKGRIDGNKVHILEGQESDSMHSFALGNCLVFLHPGKKAYATNDLVEVHLIRS